MNELSYFTSSGWKYVEAITVRQAACLLSWVDPSSYEGNRILPVEARGMEQALEQAVLVGRIPPMAAWIRDDMLGIYVPAKAAEITPHSNLANYSTIRVSDLAKWCDERGIEHCWSAEPAAGKRGLDISRFPAELRIAIEAFDAVSTDPRAVAGKHPKQALADWLAEKKPELSTNARDRIATVANWQPSGGAPKTPG